MGKLFYRSVAIWLTLTFTMRLIIQINFEVSLLKWIFIENSLLELEYIISKLERERYLSYQQETMTISFYSRKLKPES